MKVNKKSATPVVVRTHEGAPAARIDAEQQLRRVVMASMLWEDQFYVDGETSAKIIAETVPLVDAGAIAEIAIEARERQKLRHVPLFLVRELARRRNTPAGLVSTTLARVIQRADEITEFLAIYWKEGRQPLAAQVKKGLAAAFQKFDAYQLAKYDRDGAVKLRDALFLVHAKPKAEEQAATWKKLAAKELDSPDTWEVAISAAKPEEKTAEWTRLLTTGKLGALALLRNLRNLQQAGVDEAAIRDAIARMKTERVLPFRFIAAAQAAPRLEDALEEAMLRCLEEQPKMPGKTVLLVDISTSMDAKISGKSDLSRQDAANGLAILVRDRCEEAVIFAFNRGVSEIPPRRGFALRDAIRHARTLTPDGTFIGAAVQHAVSAVPKYDRLLIITDEQSHDAIPGMKTGGAKHYVINVAAYQNGIGYTNGWSHINGWSEAVIDYIREVENAAG